MYNLFTLYDKIFMQMEKQTLILKIKMFVLNLNFFLKLERFFS